MCPLSGNLSRMKSWVQRPAGWSLDCLTCLSCRPRSSCSQASSYPRMLFPKTTVMCDLHTHLHWMFNLPPIAVDTGFKYSISVKGFNRRHYGLKNSEWIFLLWSKYSTCWLSSVLSLKYCALCQYRGKIFILQYQLINFNIQQSAKKQVCSFNLVLSTKCYCS